MKIEKKLKKEYFEQVLGGVMNTDVRLADFDCSMSDVIVFKEQLIYFVLCHIDLDSSVRMHILR